MIRYFLQPLIAVVILASGLYSQDRSTQAGIKVLHYDFTLTLPDSGRTIDGYASITVVRSMDEKYLILDLLDLRVDSVLVRRERVNFQRSPDLIDIPLGSGARQFPDTIVVAIRYGGEVKDGLIIHSDAQGRWYAFGDNWPTRARCWLPTIDSPDAKATVSWNIIAPSDRKVVANGELLEERKLPPEGGGGTGARTLTRWQTFRPIPPYLMVIGVGPLITYDLGLTAPGMSEFPPGVKQTVYALPDLVSYLPGPFGRAGEIVQLFSTMIALFPFEKLAHVQSFTRFGGMENASAIFYANSYFQRHSTNPGVIAHETAHQWFGDAVTPQSWGHLWLSEGFATYFEQLWEERSSGEEKFQKGMKQLRDEIIDSRVTYERPVIDTLQTNLMRLLNTNSYQKGAWVLHMLRMNLGDSLFFSGIRAYYAHHRHENATSDDLCTDFEQVSHTQLRWFFDEWLRRPGIPDLTIAWEFDRQSHSVVLKIEQSLQFPPYRFPLKVEIVTSDGRSRTVTVDVLPQLSVRLPTQLRLDSPPAKLVFDPNTGLLAKITTR